jgi:RNA polymerase sigma-70 factor (ECF subfamily)
LQDEPSVARLVERAIQRDREAFGALFELYFERVYRYVRLKVAEPAEAEDVTMTVFSNAWRAVDHFSPQSESAFLAWLFRLARNALVDQYRRRREVARLEGINESELPVDLQFSPESTLEWQSTVDDLRQALDTLTEEQRSVVYFRFVEGLSAREVGQILGKQEGTVRGMQFRAVEALRRVLSRPKARRHRD